ncbi:PH domain-containing protein [Bacillus sp. EB600]|uniref:PH domain-containing protein n=1 Tax=Bacillus sp. EB600 TaxID=2806345 RepID=UPI00210EADE3|nr:PH domain-containing protein [Bacillus sp. EB600]MCQ6282247.1 PH domain-containing protein [Bacillus sp. EB600]
MNLEPRKRISGQALKVWRITGIIKMAIGWVLTFTVIFFVHFFRWPLWISAVILVIELIYTYLSVFFLPLLRWKRWRYDVREQEIELQHGLFIKVRTLVPMVRVQHVDTVQGPILRKYKLASVIVHTAATIHEIPALEEDEAEELRMFISKLARVADEDV